mgnify:CR=1 FL=1
MIDLDRETLVKMIDHTELSAHSGEKKIAARWFEVFERLMRQNNSFYLPVIQR